MTARETLPNVAETDATGEVAELYAEIRETLGLPVVNLIWRHFATIDGGLPWAWRTLGPLYASGAAEQAAARLVAGLSLPRLTPIPVEVLNGAGVGDTDRPVLAAILDSYNRGNALNICALGVLLPQACKADPAPPVSGPVPALPRPAAAVPGVRGLAEFPAAVQSLIWELNRLGQTCTTGDPVLATMYKHVAAWPGFLCLAWAALAPLHGNGVLAQLAADAAASARAQALGLSRQGMPVTPSAASPAVCSAAAHFVEHVIGRMIPVAQLLRNALPD